MAGLYDNIDLWFSWNGDISLDKGDIKDTSSDYLRSLIQDIHSVSASCLNDWEVYPNLAATLDDFIGEPNSKATCNAIHDRLRTAIVSLGVVSENDLNIRVIPVHIHRVLIIIRVDCIPTPWNGLDTTEALVTSLVFDFLEQGITFLEKVPELGVDQ